MNRHFNDSQKIYSCINRNHVKYVDKRKLLHAKISYQHHLVQNSSMHKEHKSIQLAYITILLSIVFVFGMFSASRRGLTYTIQINFLKKKCRILKIIKVLLHVWLKIQCEIKISFQQIVRGNKNIYEIIYQFFTVVHFKGDLQRRGYCTQIPLESTGAKIYDDSVYKFWINCVTRSRHNICGVET